MFSMKNILIKFKFQLSRAKVNVKVPVLRNMLLAVRCFHLWPDFLYNFIQISGMATSLISLWIRDKVKVTVAVKRKLFSLFWPSLL